MSDWRETMDDPTNNKSDEERNIENAAKAHQNSIPVPDSLPKAQEPQITPYGKNQHKAPRPQNSGDTEQE